MWNPVFIGIKPALILKGLLRHGSAGIPTEVGLAKTLSAVKSIRGVHNQHRMHNHDRPKMEIDAQTQAVRADGQLLTCVAAVSTYMRKGWTHRPGGD